MITVRHADESVEYPLAADRVAYLHVASSSARVNGELLNAGNSATIRNEQMVDVAGKENAEILLFDLPS